MQLMGTEPGSTLFVGDQLFTDVLGANLAGIHTVLVKPIHPKEEIQIVLKRVFERIVLFFYHRKKRPRKRSLFYFLKYSRNGVTSVRSIRERFRPATDAAVTNAIGLVR